MNEAMVRENLSRTDKPDLVVTALRFIADHGGLGDLPAVVAHSRSSHPSIQSAALQAAVAVIRSQLSKNFDDIDESMRQKLVRLLESIHPGVVDEIAKDAICASDAIRLRSLRTLALFRLNPRIRELIAKQVLDKDPKIRATAVLLLGGIIGPGDQHLVISLLSDKDKRVRANTIEALENLGNPKMIPVLVHMRKDPSNRIRANVLKALYSLGHKSIKDDLIEMLSSGNDNMKASGLWVISQTLISAREIEDAVGACMISESEMVLGNARRALLAMGTPRASGFIEYLSV